MTGSGPVRKYVLSMRNRNVTIDFQIAISWYVLYSISLSAQVYVHIQSCNLFLHIKSHVPYCSVKPPHTWLCPLRRCYPHINSYVPYFSVKPPHTWEKTEFLTLVEDIYNIQHGIMKESINLNILAWNLAIVPQMTQILGVYMLPVYIIL